MENYDTLSRYTDNFVCDMKDQREFSKFNEEFPEHSLNLTNLYKIELDEEGLLSLVVDENLII